MSDERPSAGALADHRLVVVGPPGDLIDGLCVGLAQAGASMLAATDAAVSGDDAGGPESALDGLVFLPAGDGRIRPVVTLNDQEWFVSCESVMAEGLRTLQTYFPLLKRGKGSAVFVLPTAVLTGGSGLVPFLSACEGLRLMVKSAARAWGTHGITANSVLVPVELFGFDLSPEDVVNTRWPAAIDRPQVARDVSNVVAACLSPALKSLTGGTLSIDGGLLMAP